MYCIQVCHYECVCYEKALKTCIIVSCRLICCLGPGFSCFLTLSGHVCSRQLRCGNEMTNCTVVWQNRRSLVLLNEGFLSSNDDVSDQTQKDRFTEKWQGFRWCDWLCEAWWGFPSLSLWPHPPWVTQTGPLYLMMLWELLKEKNDAIFPWYTLMR